MTGTTTLPDTPISSSWELVTVQQAEHLLDKNDNRKIDVDYVQRLKRDMAAGHFATTHQGIAIDCEGMLRDGQHRLSAQVELDVPCWWLVTRGLEPESQKRMDGGKKRQAFHFMPGSYTAVRSTGARLYLCGLACMPNVTVAGIQTELRKITAAQVEFDIPQSIYALLEKHASKAALAAKNVPTLGASPILASAALVLPEDQIEEYLQGFDLVGLTKGDPRLALATYRGASGRRVQQSIAFILALKVAQDWRDGKTISMLKPAYLKALDVSAYEASEPDLTFEVA